MVFRGRLCIFAFHDDPFLGIGERGRGREPVFVRSALGWRLTKTDGPGGAAGRRNDEPHRRASFVKKQLDKSSLQAGR